VFLMVLIIRSGLTIRREKRPSVFWAPKNNPKGKTSLTIWFHQALDILWLVNGAVFIVLLFVTGQWMRIVPTSWEVVPNALSAALQYVSLDWPTENGWVNYNALQQLAYFSTVFIAAPLAAITGFRMSGMWPKKNLKLSAAYPIEWARKVHFPVMLFFVVFIVIHVVLVLATGALRNLNHMYAAQGSVDPTAYADNWTGFWLFVVSLVVIAAAWVAARPSCSPRSPACSARSAGADAQRPTVAAARRASPQNATNSASDRRSGCGVRQNLRSSSARWGRRTRDAAGASAHEADLGERLAEERLGVRGAVEGETVARVEAVRARVVLGDPEVELLVGVDGGVEQLLPDAGAVELVEQVDEVELARARASRSRAGPDPAKPTISPPTRAANILNSGPAGPSASTARRGAWVRRSREQPC
jgi:thiosulfate reductase cytochrome b subunit